MKQILTLLPLLLATAHAAAPSASSDLPVSVNAQPTCTFDSANTNPTLDLGDYQATQAASYTGSSGEVAIYIYCNRNVAPIARRVNGSDSALTRGSALTVGLPLITNAAAPQLNVLIWMEQSSTHSVVNAGLYQGAWRYLTKVKAGWPTTPQFSVQSGDYRGTVEFSMEF